MGETHSTEGPQCPHCQTQFTADESHYYDEANYTEDDCHRCGTPFAVEVYSSTSWTCTPIEPRPTSTGGETP